MNSGYSQFFRQAKNARMNSRQVKVTSKKKVDSQRSLLNMPPQPIHKKNNVALVGWLVILGGLLSGGIWGLENAQTIDKWLSKIEIRFLGSAFAEGDPGKKDAGQSAKGEKSAAGKGTEKSSKTTAKESWTPEEVALFQKLDERKKSLDLREAELSKLDEELQKQKIDVDKKLKELEDLRQKIAKQLEEKVQEDQGRVDKLVQMYSNMKPTNAAKVFEQINEDLAVDVLSKMKQKNAAEILNLLPPDKSQRLSEKFAGYKRK